MDYCDKYQMTEPKLQGFTQADSLHDDMKVEVPQVSIQCAKQDLWYRWQVQLSSVHSERQRLRFFSFDVQLIPIC